jgi:hypothetical protein
MAILTALALSPLSVSATTWRVELDGSGDFTDIQPAVEVSAAGDTILIGPGRFDQLHPCVAPGWTEDAIVAVIQDNLTFIGAGTDETILGMATHYAPEGQYPKAFCSVDSFSGVIKNLTIENIKTGIYWWRGTLDVEECIIRGFDPSFLGAFLAVDGGTFRNCQFAIGNNALAITCTFTNDLEVIDCSFDGFGQGFATGSSVSNVSLSGCSFRDQRTAVALDLGSSGSIENTTITGSSFASLMLLNNSSMNLKDVHIEGSQYGITVTGGSVLNGYNVVIEANSISALDICCNAQVTLNNSHILPGTGLGVRTFGYAGDPFVLDLSGNYWGVTEAALIADMILDVNDDPANHCTVQFEPFADGPVPTEEKSFGSIKAMFR